jgi:hypothetical protein
MQLSNFGALVGPPITAAGFGRRLAGYGLDDRYRSGDGGAGRRLPALARKA